jgi:hypothetical protein
MKRIIYLLVAAIGLLVGCTPEEETWCRQDLLQIKNPMRLVT